MNEETGFIPVREFSDRGTRWLLESPGNVRELVRLVAADLMDLPQALHRFVPHHDTLLLSLREADPGELAATSHPLGWVLRVMQQEEATQEELAAALREAMEGLGRLPSEEQAAWRQAVYYLLLLIYHRREPQERDLLVQVVLESVRERLRREEIEKMGKTIAEALIEEGKELGTIQTRQEVLLRLLRTKFGTLPPAVVEQIEVLRDINRLDILLERVLAARSIEEMGISS